MPTDSRETDTSPMAVIRLAVDATDDTTRRQLERVWQCSYELRRAVQQDARARARALWRARNEVDRDGWNTVRGRLGLTEQAFRQAATDHLDAAGPQLRRGVTKEMAQEIGADVWRGLEHHLFRKHGAPRVDGWFDFRSITGRAKSRTIESKWPTWRLHGTLDGHRAAYDHAGRSWQPKVMRRPDRPLRNSWWNHDGPLVVVLRDPDSSGRDIVLPVRLPSAASAQPHLNHFLSDPDLWHKITIVRHRDARARGGWRYEANVTVRTGRFASDAVRHARLQVPQGRRAGADLNVSNLTVASVDHAGTDLQVTTVERDAGRREAERARAAKVRRRQQALDRSRRNSNPGQYTLSKAQQAEADRRAAAGLEPRAFVPQGPRVANSIGVPKQAYRRDTLSRSYRRTRAEIAEQAAVAARHSTDVARQVARDLIAVRGAVIATEAGTVSAWARHWGRGVAAFTPGRLRVALADEAVAAGGELRQAGTRNTACSQHCLCGSRARKDLGTRTHECAACGLAGDRDAVSATLLAHVTVDAGRPETAVLDLAATRRLLEQPATWDALNVTVRTKGRQDAPSASTHTGPNREQFADGSNGSPAHAGSARRTVRHAPNATPQQTHPGGTSADSFGSTPDLPRARRQLVGR
jgi:hypothetical protein